jgi:SAM-dependent methyltransferase
VAVQFRWEADQFHQLLADCHRDEAVPYILRNIDKQGPVLEAGCGLGRFIVFLDQQGFRDVRGIDISRDAVAILDDIAPHLNVTCGDVSDLPFDDSTIRGIVCLGVVEHFEEGPRAALEQLKRVMMPRATGIITVPYLNLIRRFKYAARIYQIRERVRAGGAIDSNRNLDTDVVARSIADLDRDEARSRSDRHRRFSRWPATGPFFEYRFGIKQFANELQLAGLSILQVASIDVISGLYYELGRPFVRTSPQGRRMVTPLGRITKGILAHAPWIHAHMALFVVQKRLSEDDPPFQER